MVMIVMTIKLYFTLAFYNKETLATKLSVTNYIISLITYLLPVH